MIRHARRCYFVFAWLLCLLDATVWAQDHQAKPDKLLTVWAGTLPIILSAPHGGRQPVSGVPVRRGVGVAQFTTEGDSHTDELAHRIATKLEERLGAKPFLVMAHFERKYIDANRPRDGAYESAEAKPYYDAYHHALEQGCAQVRREWGRGLLLDIHGQGTEVDTIFRGTGNRGSVSALERRFGIEALSGPKSILGQLALRGYRIVPDTASNERERRYTGGYTTRNYGSHRPTGIDAMQLEFGTSLRARANLNRTAGDLADAIAVFAREYLPAKKLSAGSPPNIQPP